MHINKPIFYIFLAFTFFLSSCSSFKSKLKVPPPQGLSLLQQAEQAFSLGQWEKSRRLYLQLANQTANKEKKSYFLKKIILASFQLDDCASVIAKSNQLFLLSAASQNDLEVQTSYLSCLERTHQQERLQEHLLRLALNPKINFSLKKLVLTKLLNTFFQQQRYAEVYFSLQEVWRNTQEADKPKLEETVFNILKTRPLQQLAQCQQLSQNSHLFPDNVILFTYFYQKVNQNNRCYSCWTSLRNLVKDKIFISPLFYQLFTELKPPHDLQTPTLSIILPLSGPYKKLGWQILKGIYLAQQDLNDPNFNLNIINSHAPNWQELAANSTSLIIGGPFEPAKIQQVINSQLWQDHFFFLFTPQIQEEGKKVWRFFPSRRDQVRTLVKNCLSQLQVNNFAIFYPQETYGQEMAKLFLQAVNDQNASVTSIGSYSPSVPTRWSAQVAKLLHVSPGQFKDKNFYPQPDFEAVFLPDSLNNVRGIIPYFFFYNVSYLYFLGPPLWDTDIEWSPLEQTYFQLTLYPGAWWEQSPSSGTNLLKQLAQKNEITPNFWVALGFDFVRFFAQTLSLPLDKDQLNTFLAKRSLEFNWSMAPLHWDEQGKARQDLFLFSFGSKNKIANFDLLRKIKRHRKSKIKE